ncbi:MAG: hypothetical protein AB8F78_14035 [Saprospiraceae bacterium]
MANQSTEHVDEAHPVAKSSVNWKKFLLEFLSMFFAVVLAFALSSWYDNRKTENAETSILQEISNGLELDSTDVDGNVLGHEGGLKALTYFRKLIKGEPVAGDSIGIYRRVLLRDFISIQNTSGYESLKSQGLDVIKNDALRVEIISLYEYNYTLIEKIEEQYAAQQFFTTYSERFNDAIAQNLVFDATGHIQTIKLPLVLSEKSRNRLLLDLELIEADRNFTLGFYKQITKQIERTKILIDQELGERGES